MIGLKKDTIISVWNNVVVLVLILLFVFLSFDLSYAQALHDAESCDLKKSKEAVNVYTGLIDHTLENVLKEIPPHAALSVCSRQAPRFAEILSKSRAIIIKRIGLKRKNPDMMPDSWEETVLKQFEAQKEQHKPDAILEYHENSEDFFRYARGIYMKKACISCHGGNLDPAVEKQIGAYYFQEDPAEFSEGDFMGIISVKIPHEEHRN